MRASFRIGQMRNIRTCPVSTTDNQSFDYIVVGSGAGGRHGRRAACRERPKGSRPGSRGRSASSSRAATPPIPTSIGFRTTTMSRSSTPARPKTTPCAGTISSAITATTPGRSRTTNTCRDYDGKPVDGIWYPRAGCLGGCTAHNAMIIVYPHNEDWEYLATLTGDASWGPDNMRTYFQKLENCQYRPFERDAAKRRDQSVPAWI